MNVCDFCEKVLPEGCRHLLGQYPKCQVGPRTDLPWRIGLAIWRDLNDRRGIKHEMDRCEDPIKVEIIEAMGRLAIEVMSAQSPQPTEERKL